MNNKLLSQQICFTCNHYLEALEKVNATTDGRGAYVTPSYRIIFLEVTPKNPNKHNCGSYASTFYYKHNDGWIAKCSNVWDIGHVPQHMKDRFIPNITEIQSPEFEELRKSTRTILV